MLDQVDNQRCLQPFDCGSQFKCVDGRCIPAPECGTDTNGCEDPEGGCLGPGAIPIPDPDTPNCGLGDPNANPFARRDCIFNCNIFCDEWEKVAANLSDDTEIKDCHPDDACSACKSCQPGPDSPDEAAVRKAFDAAIDEVYDNLEFKKEEQEFELEELEAERDADLEQIKLDLLELDDEIKDLNEAILQDPGNQALRDERNEKILEQNDKRQEGYDRETQYRNDLRNMNERHADERDAYFDQIKDLREEKNDRLKAMKNRGVCKNKKAGVDRPCYCNPYIDEDTGKLVDDSKGRECYLCNTEDGIWEYKNDLCTLTCERCIVCQDGQELCASLTLPEDEAGDICLKAREKAEKRCKKVEELEKRCPYPQQACQVEGPNPGGNLTAEVAEDGHVAVLQGGSQKLTSLTGEITKLRIDISADATGSFSVVSNGTAYFNGGNIKPLIGRGYFVIAGSDDRPEENLTGRPKVIGPVTSGEFCLADTSEVTSSEGESAVYEYRWFADNEPLTWTPERYPLNEDTGEQYNPGNKYTPGQLLEEPDLLIANQDAGKLIQVGIRLSRGEETPDESRPLTKSQPYGPMKSSPDDFTQGEVTIFGEGNTYSALSIDLSDLESRYYPKYFPILIDWIAVDTGQSVSANDHVFLREWAEGRVFYAACTIFDDQGDPHVFISNSIGPISVGGPPTAEPSGDPSSISITMTGNTIQDEVLSVTTTWSLSNLKVAGPYYSWYINDELVYGLWYDNVRLNQATVGNVVSASSIIYDEYGTPYSATVYASTDVENVPSVATGSAWLIGPQYPAEGDTLRVINNIKDEDGFNEGAEGDEGGIKYQWQVNGLNIEGAVKQDLKLTSNLDLVDGFIRCLVWWTTNYGQEKTIYTEEVGPVLPGDGNYSIYPGPDQYDVANDQQFILPINITGPAEDGAAISDIYHEWKIIHSGEGTVSFFPDPSVAIAGSLVADVWDDDETPEGTCEEGWDCYKTQVNPNNSEDAPLGSTFFVKCPYPGYPELTYEESKSEKCKLLCGDYCYSWSVERPEGNPPILGEDTRILYVWNNNGTDIYTLETCAEHPDGEEACPPNFKNNYISVWSLETPEINVWRCNCEAALGETFNIPATIEYSNSTPGFGPWELDPDYGDFYPICGEDEPFPPEGVQGATSETANKPCIEGERNFNTSLFGCTANFSQADRGENVCATRRRGFVRSIRQFTFCGNFSRDPKPNPQRGFIIKDREGKLNVQYHGYSMWPFVYRNWMINGLIDTDQFDTGPVGGLGWSPRLFNPGVPAESLPPRCVSAPTQIAYYSIADNTFYSTLATYKQIVGELWYKCNKTPQSELSGLDEERCARCDEYDGTGPGAGLLGCEVDPEYTIPIQMTYVRGARFIEIRDGDQLYAGGGSEILPPGPPKREATDGQKTPAVTGPLFASYSNSNDRRIARMVGTANDEEAPLDTWRFSNNKSSTDPSGLFSIDPNSGQIRAKVGDIPAGSYGLPVQARFLNLWSKSVTITVRVFD